MISKFLKFPFAFALVAVLLVACNKDNEILSDNPPTIENTTNPTQIQNLVVVDSAGCYEIVFPITFLYEDGTTQTANSEVELFDIFEAEPSPINIEFPVNLEDLTTGETVTAANEEELDTYLEDCDFDDWDDEPNPCDSIDFDFGQLACYNFVFPISFVLEDGTTVTAQSADDLENIFDENNEPEDFVYPISLENVDEGEVVTANNEEELEQLIEACFDFDGGGGEESIVYPVTFVSVADDSLGNENCYTYVYPVNLLTEGNETITVNNDQEILAAIFGGEDVEDFVYPIQVINNEDGATITVNNEEEAEDLVENCE